MSFIKQNLGNKPSFLKIISILIVISLIVIAAYSFLKKKEVGSLKEESVQEIKSSGLDQGKEIKTVGDVTGFTKEGISKFKYMGPKAVEEIEKFLKSKNLSFTVKDKPFEDTSKMNLFERYETATKEAKLVKISSDEGILIGIFNILESEELLGPEWLNKTPSQKNSIMKDMVSRFDKWKNMAN